MNLSVRGDSTQGLMPVDVQQRADAELGAAFRRAEEARPDGFAWGSIGCNYEGDRWYASVWNQRTGQTITGRAFGPTPAAALDALTAALADRGGA